MKIIRYAKNSPLAILRRARRLLSKHWTKRHYYNSATQCFCARGAIYQAAGVDLTTGQNPFLLPSSREVDAARMTTGICEGATKNARGAPVTLETWNDDPRRTLVQVLAFFDKLIAQQSAEPGIYVERVR